MALNLKEQKYISKYAHNKNTDWFSRAGYGLFFHVLPEPDEFDDFQKNFDAEKLAKQCYECGAAYVFFTVGQNSGLINVPSRVYERYSGKPELCCTRDLVDELYAALSEYNIKLMLYVPADAPKNDIEVAKGFGCMERNPEYTKDWIITEEFEARWCEFLEELSKRYKDKIYGWWVDGFYEWSGCDNNTAMMYSKALKSGNENAIVAFNGGVNSYFYPSEYDDYLPGERGEFMTPVCDGRWINQIQWHELSFISEFWGRGELMLTADQIAEQIKSVSGNGGVISIDLPMEKNLSQIRNDAYELMKKVKQKVRE